MTLVVSDNSPLDILVRLGHAGLLPRLFGAVAVPTQVRNELLAPNTPQETRSFIESPPTWLTVREPQAVPEIPKELSRNNSSVFGRLEALFVLHYMVYPLTYFLTAPKLHLGERAT